MGERVAGVALLLACRACSPPGIPPAGRYDLCWGLEDADGQTARRRNWGWKDLAWYRTPALPAVAVALLSTSLIFSAWSVVFVALF